MRADGVPVWDEKCKPAKGKAAEQLIENLPKWAGPPVYLEKPHSAMPKMDYCKSDLSEKVSKSINSWSKKEQYSIF